MFKHLWRAIAGLAIVVAPSAALAAGWNGFYSGLTGGFAGGNIHVVPVPACGCAPFDIQSSGAIGGLVGGYNFEMGHAVLGLEADASFSNFGGAFGPTTGSMTWLTTIRGRLGFPMNQFLPFVSAGIGYGHFEAGFDSPREGGQATSFAGGVGVDVMLTPNIVARGEYLFTHLNPIGVDLGSGDPHADISVNANILRAAVVFRLGN